MMRKTFIWITLVLSLVLSVGITGYSASETRTVTDMAGRTVVIPKTVNRVVLVHGTCNVPSIMSAAGVADKLIAGLCFRFPGEDLQIKVEPGYAKLNTFKPNSNGMVNIEELLTLKPDVVFVWKENIKNIDAIQAAGIPVVVLYILSWDDVKTGTRLIGDVMNVSQQSRRLIAYMDGNAKKIKTKVAKIPPEKRKKVLFVDNPKPLTVPGNEGFNGYMIETCGGVSVTSKLTGYFAETSLESVYAANPDIIIVSGFQRNGYESMLINPEWTGLRAIKNKQIYLAPRGVFMWNKPAVEAGLFLLWQTSKIYPELVSEQEVRKEAVAFYQKFFNYNLSKEELDGLFDHP